MLLRGQNLLGYRHYSDDVVQAFVAKAAENGIDVFRIFDAMNDVRNLQAAIDAVNKAGKHAQGTISYTTSPVHTIESFVEQAKQMADMGVQSIAIKDMAGLLTPFVTGDLVKALKEALDLPVFIHSHDTAGLSTMCQLKAIENGADRSNGLPGRHDLIASNNNGINLSLIERSINNLDPAVHTSP